MAQRYNFIFRWQSKNQPFLNFFSKTADFYGMYNIAEVYSDRRGNLT